MTTEFIKSSYERRFSSDVENFFGSFSKRAKTYQTQVELAFVSKSHFFGDFFGTEEIVFFFASAVFEVKKNGGQFPSPLKLHLRPFKFLR